MEDPSLDLSIRLWSRIGEDFVLDYYYYLLDAAKPMTANFFVDGLSALVWSGTVLSGFGAIERFLGQLPPSQHTIQALDVVPLEGAAATAALQGGQRPELLVQVSGTVSYGGGVQQPFSDSLVLLPHPKNKDAYCVASAAYRVQEGNK